MIVFDLHCRDGGETFEAWFRSTADYYEQRSAGLVHNGTIELKGHQSVDVSLTPAAGTYPLKCSHTLHAAFGMKGTIRVD